MPSLAPCAVNRIATDAFPASQRLDQWEAYNASFLVGLRCSSYADEGLNARQSNMRLGQLAMADIDGNAHVIERTPQLVRQHPKESVSSPWCSAAVPSSIRSTAASTLPRATW